MAPESRGRPAPIQAAVLVAFAAATSCDDPGRTIPERVAEICGDYCAALQSCELDYPACALECQEALEKSPEEQIDDCANRLQAWGGECEGFFRWVGESEACASALEADGKLVGQSRWNRFRGGVGAEGLSGIAQTVNGYVVAGYTSPDGAQDAWIYSVDQQGEAGWDVVLGGDEPDAARSVRADGDGFVVAGFTRPGNADDQEAWVIKLDATGGVEWDRTLGAEGGGTAEDVGVVDDGYLVAGHGPGEDGGDLDGMVWRIDADGSVLWQKELGVPGGPDLLYAIEPVIDGGCVAAGSVESAGNVDGRVLRLDAGGEIVWDRTFGAGGTDELRSVSIAPEGWTLVAGTIDGSTDSQDAWVLALDEDGEALWERRYGPDLSREAAWSIHADEGGGFVFSGTRQEVGGATGDVWVVGADAEGEPRLDEMVGVPTLDDVGAEVLPTRDAGYAVAAVRGMDATGGDAWLLKLDGAGQSCTAGAGIFRACYGVGEIWSFDECGTLLEQVEVCAEGLGCVRDTCSQ